MNRRSLIQLAGVAPLAAIPQPIREIRANLTIDSTIRSHFIVRSHFSSKSAEEFRRRWIGRPFEGQGEWYVNSNDRRELPPNLATMPGTLSFHEATLGAAAEKRTYLVGAFRRDYIAIIVRIVGDHEAMMLDIGDHIAELELPSAFEATWHPIHLEALIPKAPDLGAPVKEAENFWP